MFNVVGLHEDAFVGRTRKILSSIHRAIVAADGEVGELNAVPISVGKVGQPVVDDEAAAVAS